MSGFNILPTIMKRFLIGLCLVVATGTAVAQNPFSGSALSQTPTSSSPTQTPSATGGRAALPVGAISTVGPGDALQITVFGQPELSAVITVSVDGDIIVPVVGTLKVADTSPSAIAQRIAAGLRSKNYLQDPQVSVEVLQVRSQVTSILGEVMRPGRYPLEGRLTLLELLAMAGGLKDTADDTAVLLRKSSSPFAVNADASQSRLELYVGGRQALSREVQDVPLQPGDVVYIGPAKRFYIYGEVGQSGAYPMEEGLTVMRAISIGGGLSQRASDRRISIHRKTADSTTEEVLKVKLTDSVLPGDVIYVDERFF